MRFGPWPESDTSNFFKTGAYDFFSCFKIGAHKIFSDFSKLVPTIFFKIFKTGAYEAFILKNDENGYLYLADGEYLVTIGTLALLLFFGSIFDFLT